MSADFDAPRVRHHQVAPTRAIAGLAEDVRAGLLVPPRWLPPKYFYDDHGSRLFESICETPEYYPTRAEAALLAESAERIVEQTRPGHIIELGSGNSRKTRHLIAACDRLGLPARYWPFEVSTQIMLDAAAELTTDYGWLEVDALTGDYTAGLAHLPLPDDSAPRLFLFLGGTLGNFEPEAADVMLDEIRALMRPGDALLLGLDRVKDRQRLEAAYDDAAGYTAAFNRNVLTVLNRELDGDIPVADYRHRALFDHKTQRIEMRLVAERAHRVSLKTIDAAFGVEAGEEILTEISRKFTPDSIADLLARARLRTVAHFEQGEGDYSLVLAAP